MRYSAALLLALSCSPGADSAESGETAGNEAVDDGRGSTASSEAPTDRTGFVGVRGTAIGEAHPLTPEERAAAQARRAASRAERQAEYQARCASVALTPGLPPPPPAASTAGLTALRPAYEAALAPEFAQPTDLSTTAVNTWARRVFAAWLRDSVARLQELSRQVAQAPEGDREHARGWLGHAQAAFVERFHSTPIPTEIANDPDLRGIYTEAIVTRSSPLIDQARQAIGGATLRGAWAAWQADAMTWLAQESCAFH